MSVYKTPVRWCYEEIDYQTEEEIEAWTYKELLAGEDFEYDGPGCYAFLITTYCEPKEYLAEYDVIKSEWVCCIECHHTNYFDRALGYNKFLSEDVTSIDCDLVFSLYVDGGETFGNNGEVEGQ